MALLPRLSLAMPMRTIRSRGTRVVPHSAFTLSWSLVSVMVQGKSRDVVVVHSGHVGVTATTLLLLLGLHHRTAPRSLL